MRRHGPSLARTRLVGSTVALLGALVSAGGLRADEAGLPHFGVERVDGKPVVGVLEGLHEDGSVRLLGATPDRVAGSEVLSLRRVGVRLPARPTGPQILCPNGDQLPGELLGLTGERLRFRAAIGGQEMELPLAALSALWFAAPEGGDDLAHLRRRWAGERRNQDRVLLRNGDAIEGSLLGLNEQTLRVEVRRKEVQVPRDRVAAVALNTTLIRFPVPRTSYVHLVLANGTRLALASALCADGQLLTGKTLFGVGVRVPVQKVIALDRRQGRATYLSDLKPQATEQIPYLDLAWPSVADGSVVGGDLRLAGSTYDKGLGVHSRCRLTYAVPAGAQYFEALVGFDDGTGLRDGEVRVEVQVDGKSQDLGWDGVLRAVAPPRRVRVPLTKARQLTLLVEFGRRGDVNGRIDWADARLVK